MRHCQSFEYLIPQVFLLTTYIYSLKYSKEQAQPSFTNDVVSIVVKSTKRQRDAYKSHLGNENSIPESSDSSKRRKTLVNENLALPTLPGKL